MALVAAVVSSMVLGQAAAQANARAEAMAVLAPLVGEWVGTGWSATRDGRMAFESREIVESKAGGTIFSVTGRQWVKEAGGMERVTYDAFGTISFDPATKVYSLTNNFSTGQSVSYPLTLVPGGFTWKVGTAVEMELKIVDGEWVEKGWRVTDTRTQIFEIRAKRKG